MSSPTGKPPTLTVVAGLGLLDADRPAGGPDRTWRPRIRTGGIRRAQGGV